MFGHKNGIIMKYLQNASSELTEAWQTLNIYESDPEDISRKEIIEGIKRVIAKMDVAMNDIRRIIGIENQIITMFEKEIGK